MPAVFGLPVSGLPTGEMPVGRTIGSSWPDAIGLVGIGYTNGSPAANLATYVPFVIREPLTVRKVWYQVGGTATGSVNLDIGIYSSAGVKLVSTGSIAYATGSPGSYISIDITDTILSPGLYYMALAIGTITGTAQFSVLNPTLGVIDACGALQQATAFPLPATATWVHGTSNFLPDFGITGLAQA